MIKRLYACMCLLSVAAASQAAIAWYGGDFDNRNGAPNEINGLLADARTYDDFTLSGATTVNAVFSHNLWDTFTSTQAAVEIRTGVSVGNAGTLVFSGTFPASVTDTGRSGFGMTEKKVRVSGLSVNLNAGTYFLSVTPIGNGVGRSYVSTAAGVNGVGIPLANGNTFVNCAQLGFTFASAGYLGAGNWDFSMGVESGAAPLNFSPTTLNSIRGTHVSGDLNALLNSDNVRLVKRPGAVFTTGQSPIVQEIIGTAPQQTATELRLRVESHASSGSISQKVSMFDYVSGVYVLLDTRNMTVTDNQIDVVITTNASRFIQAGSRQIKALIEYKAAGPVVSYPWEARIDHTLWSLVP